jgi:hypothetical protein
LSLDYPIFLFLTVESGGDLSHVFEVGSDILASSLGD